MSWNVPDDWNSYYYSCGCHASYGCECKEGQLENSERPWLNESGYDLDEGTWSRRIYYGRHTARRDHKDGRVKAGQIYIRKTFRKICDETGDTWLTHTKRVVK